MAHYVAVDVEGLKKILEQMPVLPGLLIYLAWGAIQINSREKLEHFSRTGLFNPESRVANGHTSPHQIAS